MTSNDPPGPEVLSDEKLSDFLGGHLFAALATTYVVVEGTAELAETTTPGDAVGRELLAMGFELPAPEQEIFQRQVEEGRVVIRLRAGRVYGRALDLPQEMREL